MSVLESTSVVWVVMDSAGREVVLMCSGADAGEVVAEWEERGCHAVALQHDAGTAA